MNHYHIFWTRPLAARRQLDDFLELLDFEALTWVASALEVRRHSPMHLITDSEGAAYFRDSGLDWIYDGISTELDEMPGCIHPAIFWDGGKMFAFRSIETPCVIMDYDAILWRPLEPGGHSMALHEEQRNWSFYSSNRDQFGRFGFDSAEWDWELNPVNTGLVYFNDDRLPREAGGCSVAFMTEYSRQHDLQGGTGLGAPAAYNRATLFAGQRLLRMCAGRLGRRIDLLTGLDECGLTLERNPYCSHLWLSKALYRCCPEARAAYVNYLISHLTRNHPECRSLLQEWGLDRAKPVDPSDRLGLDHLGRTDQRRKRLRRFLGVEGEVVVEDAHVPALRLVETGSLLLPGEKIHAADGSHYHLQPAEPETMNESLHELQNEQERTHHSR